MSNYEASRVYESLLESVVNEVREDFENAGIDEQTLQDLKRVWQNKLSEAQVARFSWDEETGPVMVSSNGVDTNLKLDSDPSYLLSKSESQGLVLPGFSNEQNLKVGYPNGASLPYQQQQQQQQQQQEQPSDDSPSADGKTSTTTTIQAEQDQASNLKSESFEIELQDPDGSAAEKLRQEAKKNKRSALLDTDEVGSELDDSDDDYLISEGEEDGPDENLLLCLYEKVTRTKARWKCSLRDGIVTLNRKDYTFQKASVEAEWV